MWILEGLKRSQE